MSDFIIKDRFRYLVNLWRQETGKMALAHKIVFHHAYQQIIGMGQPAIPFILKELKHHKEDWFWALMMITGENLFSEDDT